MSRKFSSGPSSDLPESSACLDTLQLAFALTIWSQAMSESSHFPKPKTGVSSFLTVKLFAVEYEVTRSPVLSPPVYNKENYTLRGKRWATSLPQGLAHWWREDPGEYHWPVVSSLIDHDPSCFCVRCFESAESDHCNYPLYSFCQSVLVRDQYYGSAHSLSTCLNVLNPFK